MTNSSHATTPFDDVRLGLASLSGEADATWAREGAAYADIAFLGGIALDEAARTAARELVARDRNEFLPPEPLAFLDEQLAALADVPLQAAINVRSATIGPLREAASIAAERDAVLEINAHCRQPELCAVGCGEALLADTERLCEYVAASAESDAITCVKVRAEVPGVDLAHTARRVAAAGADAIHVDAMDSEAIVRDVTETADLFVVANNEVRDRDSVFEYLEYGADAVSVGRPSGDPVVLDRVRTAVDDWFEKADATTGSANAATSDTTDTTTDSRITTDTEANQP